MRILVAALALAGMTSAAWGQPSRPNIDKRVAELSEFVRLVTGYKTTAPPRILFRTRCQLGAMSGWTSSDPSDCDPMDTGGAAAGNVIFLRDDFTLGRDDYILVHELVHYMQFEAGKDGDGCRSRLEPEAYHAQDIFVAATGIGKRSDPFTVMVMVGACSGP